MSVTSMTSAALGARAPRPDPEALSCPSSSATARASTTRRHGAGPRPLVFAHGLGGGHLQLVAARCRTSRGRYTCGPFAQPGVRCARGRRPAGRGPCRATWTTWRRWWTTSGLADVRLVAQSMGGWTCLGYALRHPDRVRALVMACTTGTLDDPETLSIFRAHGAARPEAAVFAKGIHPACGERMAREQPGLHFLYREVDALSTDSTTAGAEEADRDAGDAASGRRRAPGRPSSASPARRTSYDPAGRRHDPRVDRPRRPARAGAGGWTLRLLGAPRRLQSSGGRVPPRRRALTQGRAPLRHDAPPAGARRPRPGRGRRADPAPARRRERRALHARPGTSLARRHAPDRRGDLVRARRAR